MLRRVLFFTAVTAALGTCPAGVARAQSDSGRFAEADAAQARLEHRSAVRALERIRTGSGDAGYGMHVRLARVWNDVGQDEQAAGRRDSARAAFDQSMAYASRLTASHADSSEAWFLLAVATGNAALFRGGGDKVRMGRDVETWALLAAELDGSRSGPHVVLGIFYREVSELSWVQRTLARALFGGIPAGTTEKAVASLRRAISLDPALPLAHYELGRTLLRSGDEVAARPHLEQAAVLAPRTAQDVRNAADARRLLED